MELAVEERTVAGTTFEFTMMTATEARKVHMILMRALGPALGALGKKDIKAGALTEAIGNVLMSLNDEDMKQLVDKICRSSRVHVDGAKPKVNDIYDIYFAGKPKLHWLFVVEGIKVNLGDFLDDGLLSKLKDLVAKMSASKSQSTSTGSSGDQSQQASAL